MLADNGTLGRVADGIADVAGGAVASGRRNAGHRAKRFPGFAALAAALGVLMSAFALERAAEMAKQGRVPTDEWARRAQLAAAGGAGLYLTRVSTGMLRRLRGGGLLSRGCALCT